MQVVFLQWSEVSRWYNTTNGNLSTKKYGNNKILVLIYEGSARTNPSPKKRKKKKVELLKEEWHTEKSYDTVLASTSLGLQLVFWRHINPSLSFEKVSRTSQCKDFAMFSISLMISTLSRTISFPSGLRIRSTSAITGNSLHLQENTIVGHKYRGRDEWIR